MKTKRFLVAAFAAMMVIGTSMTALASEGWQKNETGWWYSTAADDSTWYANEWQWIDGNKDGIAECYLFNADGYMYADCVTPDGYTVDANGAWTTDGAVETKEVPVSDEPVVKEDSSTGINSSTASSNLATGYNEYGISNAAIDMLSNTREENEKYGEVDVEIYASGTYVTYENGLAVNYAYTGKKVQAVDENFEVLFKDYKEGLNSVEEVESYLLSLGFKHGYIDDGTCYIYNSGSVWINAASKASIVWQVRATGTDYLYMH